MSDAKRRDHAQEEGPKKLHEYSGGGIAVRYERKKCVHAGECARGLPGVFDPKKRRWISPENAEPATVAAVVAKCPSGALTYEMLSNGEPGAESKTRSTPEAPATPAATPAAAPEGVEVFCLPNGPVRLRGSLKFEMPDGTFVEKTKAHLCRCGASNNKPFCDGQHKVIGFEA